MSLTVLYWILVAVMIVGVIGAVVPAVPGSSLILGAIIIWGVVNGFASVSWALGVAIFILLLSIGIDFLASYYGAKRAGASNWGQIGAIVGLVLGIVGLLPALPVGGPLVGILFGPLLGAFVGEFLYRRELETTQRLQLSIKAGIGIIVGSLIGNLIQGILALAAVIVFIATTYSQALPPANAGVNFPELTHRIENILKPIQSKFILPNTKPNDTGDATRTPELTQPIKNP